MPPSKKFVRQEKWRLFLVESRLNADRINAMWNNFAHFYLNMSTKGYPRDNLLFNIQENKVFQIIHVFQIFINLLSIYTSRLLLHIEVVMSPDTRMAVYTHTHGHTIWAMQCQSTPASTMHTSPGQTKTILHFSASKLPLTQHNVRFCF